MEDEAYRLWVNEDKTVLFRVWPKAGHDREWAEIATRPSPDATWGLPVKMTEEKVSS